MLKLRKKYYFTVLELLAVHNDSAELKQLNLKLILWCTVCAFFITDIFRYLLIYWDKYSRHMFFFWVFKYLRCMWPGWVKASKNSCVFCASLFLKCDSTKLLLIILYYFCLAALRLILKTLKLIKICDSWLISSFNNLNIWVYTLCFPLVFGILVPSQSQDVIMCANRLAVNPQLNWTTHRQLLY